MKHILAGISLALLTTAGFAATTCLHNNSAVAILQKSVDPVSVTHNAANMTFTLTFNYDVIPNTSIRTIRGAATCNEVDTNTADATAKMGDANTHLRSADADVGTMCWCSLAGPVTSWWVFYKAYSDEDACAAGCAADCASAIRNNTSNFRSNGVYMAIW
ncbi:hypothetical protein HDR61_00230 [bacterium]|nr:hypothetical protein [bacterium]